MTLISLDITSLTLKKAWRVMKEQQQNAYLQILPAATAGKILNNESIICPYRRTISVSSPAPISTF